jgi:hypothetical protein
MMSQGDFILYKVIFAYTTEIGRSLFSDIGRELYDDTILIAGLNNYLRAVNVFKGRRYWR